jgi:hypothetical protein
VPPFDEIVEGVVAVEVAGERHHLVHAARRQGRRRGAVGGDPRQRADLQGDIGVAGEMAEQFADPSQVARAHLVADEGIGRVQHRRVVAPGGLQRLQPGMDVLGGKLGFKAFEATGPGIHTFDSAQ